MLYSTTKYPIILTFTTLPISITFNVKIPVFYSVFYYRKSGKNQQIHNWHAVFIAGSTSTRSMTIGSGEWETGTASWNRWIVGKQARNDAILEKVSMKKRSVIVSKVVLKGIQKRHKRNEGREGILNAKAKRG
jgi:hypothetical protein